MATGRWMVATAAASTGVLADFDPAMQPTKASFWPFLFVAVALVLLMLSMVRHLRRARTNLGSERARPDRSPRSDEVVATPVEPDERPVPDQPR